MVTAAADLMPADAGAVAKAVAGAARDRTSLHIRGGATKVGWGAPVAADVTLSTAALTGVVAYRPGDFVVTVRAGTRLADLATALAAEDQMLALDPPDPDGCATIGGVLATADSGPLRHRYGGPRDLLLGVRAVLGDGAVVRSGSAVIKNVAGYDLGRLMSGAFGTLGVIVEATLRVHPLPARRITVHGATDSAARLAAAIGRLRRLPLEAEALDVRWDGDGGALLVRCAGAAPEERTTAVEAALGAEGLAVELLAGDADAAAWAHQRSLQRGADGCVVRIAAPPGAARRVLELASAPPGRRVAGRAEVGTWWLTLPSDDEEAQLSAIAAVRAALPEASCMVTDGPADVRAVAASPLASAAVAALVRRLREQFDPAGILNPGILQAGDG